ncbi:hypothetical protein DFS34DRAFT_60022 [Phlyctochytrium arcticum]|nr:hypothetical protein DFS34DRAFT_60022 [Phlyctochytrium arcticum]
MVYSIMEYTMHCHTDLLPSALVTPQKTHQHEKSFSDDEFEESSFLQPHDISRLRVNVGDTTVKVVGGVDLAAIVRDVQSNLLKGFIQKEDTATVAAIFSVVLISRGPPPAYQHYLMANFDNAERIWHAVVTDLENRCIIPYDDTQYVRQTVKDATDAKRNGDMLWLLTRCDLNDQHAFVNVFTAMSIAQCFYRANCFFGTGINEATWINVYVVPFLGSCFDPNIQVKMWEL